MRIIPEQRFEPTVSILAEVPEALHEALLDFMESHSDWDHDRVFAAALGLFLLQNGSVREPGGSQNYRRAARAYLDALFKHAA